MLWFSRRTFKYSYLIFSWNSDEINYGFWQPCRCPNLCLVKWLGLLEELALWMKNSALLKNSAYAPYGISVIGHIVYWPVNRLYGTILLRQNSPIKYYIHGDMGWSPCTGSIWLPSSPLLSSYALTPATANTPVPSTSLILGHCIVYMCGVFLSSMFYFLYFSQFIRKYSAYQYLIVYILLSPSSRQ